LFGRRVIGFNVSTPSASTNLRTVDKYRDASYRAASNGLLGSYEFQSSRVKSSNGSNLRDRDFLKRVVLEVTKSLVCFGTFGGDAVILPFQTVDPDHGKMNLR
jgi:hypothetical protein